MVNFEWYRTFKTIYECNSISEASKKLFMTQPGVSKHLSALEAQIGKKLFIRTSRKTLPTEFGKFLYIQISTSVSGLEKAEALFTKAEKKHCASIVIGAQYDYFKKALLHQLPQLDMFVTMQFDASENLAKSVEDGSIHLLLGTNKYLTYPHVFHKLKQEKLLLVGSNDLDIPSEIRSEDAGSKKLESWLKSQNWFAFDNTLPYTAKFWIHHFNKRPQIKATIVFPCFEGLLDTMKNINALCIIPQYACQKAIDNNEIQIVLPNLPATNDILYCSHKANSENLYEIRLFKERLNLTP